MTRQQEYKLRHNLKSASTQIKPDLHSRLQTLREAGVSLPEVIEKGIRVYEAIIAAKPDRQGV